MRSRRAPILLRSSQFAATTEEALPRSVPMTRGCTTLARPGDRGPDPTRSQGLSHSLLIIPLLAGGCFSDDVQRYWSPSHGGFELSEGQSETSATAQASGGAREDQVTGRPSSGSATAGEGGLAESHSASHTPEAPSWGGGENAGGNLGEAGGVEALGHYAGGGGRTTEEPGQGGVRAGGSLNYAGADPAAAFAETSVDSCPDDPNKREPGSCGCGKPETRLCLAHRYSFDASGTDVIDSIGKATGSAQNCRQSGSGDITLADSGYVALPDGILSSAKSTTLEAWVTWHGGEAWQRIVDFGDSTDSGQEATGQTYVYVTAKSANGKLRASFSVSGSANAVSLEAPEPLPVNTMTHVALVLEAFGTESTNMTLYMNGVATNAPVTVRASLASIRDVNNWLGRSQFSDDPYFAGVFQEFRIYNSARNASQIHDTYAAGPDRLPNE